MPEEKLAKLFTLLKTWPEIFMADKVSHAKFLREFPLSTDDVNRAGKKIGDGRLN